MTIMPRKDPPPMRCILVVGNPPSIDPHITVAELLQVALADGLDFIFVDTGAAAVNLLDQRGHLLDAVLLNAELPDIAGAALCSRLRKRGFQFPLLVMGNSNCEAAVVRCLEAGASDYIGMPVRIGEMCARLRAQIRTYEASDGRVMPIGPFEFRPCSRVLFRRDTGAQVSLTEKESKLLSFLYDANRPITRARLLKEVWGYNSRMTTHTVETHIYRLRRKMEPVAGRITLLVNQDGGYLLLRGGADLDLAEPRWRSNGELTCSCDAS